MTRKDEIKAAFLAAIRTVGMEQFKRCSFFVSKHEKGVKE